MIRSATIKRRIQTAPAAFFMLAYIFALIGNPIHLLHHADGEEICFEADNACHLKLVHADNVNGCDHESHFIEDNNLQCELCAIASSSKPALLGLEKILLKPETRQLGFYQYEDSPVDRSLRSGQNRGPPFIS